MSRGMTRAERLQELERLYTQHRNGFTDIELAERLGVDRTTIFRDRTDLERQIPFIEVDPGRWAIDRMKYLSSVRLNLSEALALYLAARRMSRHTRTGQTHVISALEKLAVALKQPMTERLVQTAAGLAGQAPDLGRVAILETLARGWAEQRQVRITHKSLRGTRSLTYTLSPYLIEPSLWSDGAYVIGHSDVHNGLATFKIERIEQATLTTSPFTIPDQFDEQELLRFAWGIWYSDQAPVTVKLKFTGREAVTRLKESIWHPSQQPLEETPDGGCIWTAQVAEWQEMLPWIRGWGADCEVMEPEELREELMRETRRMARVYGLASQTLDSQTSRLLRLWGKTSPGSQDPDDFHPVMFHMLDVGNVARQILRAPSSRRWRDILATALGADGGAIADWLPYFVGLHDIGKVSATFQSINKGQAVRLKHEGFSLVSSDVRHPTISQIFVADSLSQIMGTSPNTLLIAVDEALGGHHGRFVDPEDAKRARRELRTEPPEWQALRQSADLELRKEFVKRDMSLLSQPANISTAVMALTGFTILCDWLGSDGRYFHPMPDSDLSSYIRTSSRCAERAVQDSGLLTPAASTAPCNVESLFDDLGTLRPLQHAIDDIPVDLLQAPSLTIIEAPTGEGKTEAALALAHRIGTLSGTDEMYYALPTMATSNQMFGRLQTHLVQRLELTASVKLVHGQAFLVEDELRTETPPALMEPLGNGSAASQATEAVAWFNSKKRALLAPFGVGTIDQVELAALNVKHAALRMMGLVGKVVIVDEVHAYDTYMTTIVERLLRWLATMNTSVILLSATLPLARRKQLAEAYGVSLGLPEEQLNAYPSLLVLSRKGIHFASPPVWQPDRTIELCELHLGDDESQAKADCLLNAVTNGGCVCWITNTVKRAQRIFKALLDSPLPAEFDLDLLHSQFPLDERQHREQTLNVKYGRSGNRPVRGIVVGTQVLEQSLDLDFDVMVSDLAPVDLLLQRAGRLHRHARERPPAHNLPRLYLNWETTAAGDLKLGTDRTIYAEYIFRQTQRTLAGRTDLQLPRDYRTLIEEVYSDQEPAVDDALHEAWEDLQDKQGFAVGEAKQRLLPAPHPRDSFAQAAATRVTFEEDENRADWIVAQTRLGEASLNVIPLEREDEWAFLDIASERIPVNAEAALETQRRLLRRNLRLSQRDAIQALQEDAERSMTQLFKESKLLRGYYPLWLHDGQAEFKLERGRLRIKLDHQLGLMIEKEGNSHDNGK